MQTQTDLQASYVFKLGGPRRATLLADVFNLFNQKRVLDYDNYTSLVFGGGDNPDMGAPISNVFAGAPPQFQTPLQMRVGVRFEF